MYLYEQCTAEVKGDTRNIDKSSQNMAMMHES